MENDMSNKLPAYAVIIAKVAGRQRGDVLVTLTTPSGQSQEVWIDDSNVAPLSEDEAAEISQRWNIALPD